MRRNAYIYLLLTSSQDMMVQSIHVAFVTGSKKMMAELRSIFWWQEVMLFS
jgi:hypothetical protein